MYVLGHLTKFLWTTLYQKRAASTYQTATKVQKANRPFSCLPVVSGPDQLNHQ